jgi:hypothetical protein
MNLVKFPRIHHLSFSQQIHKDDKTIENPEYFLNKEIIITEKLDGSNCCFFEDKWFSRSGELASGSWFNILKNKHFNNYDKNFMYFGENMYAKHSIYYDKLTDWFYLFEVYDPKRKLFLSLNERNYLPNFPFNFVPSVWCGVCKSLKELEKILLKEIKKESYFGKEREGFVVRTTNYIFLENYSSCVAKFVRENHVQTDEHWTKTWRPNELKLN